MKACTALPIDCHVMQEAQNTTLACLQWRMRSNFSAGTNAINSVKM